MQSNNASDAPDYETLGFPRLLVVIATIVVTGWYMWWRLGTINPDAKVFSWLLYGAEWFGISTLLLHFFMVRRLTIREAPLPEPGHTVDVFIPTINESVETVRRTVVTAMAMEYPHTTYVLDDGRREEIRQMALELGCQYITRDNNDYAKAGNLNNAFRQTSGEFIALFDADHAPKNTFLVRTLGYFRNPKVAFVQTPQDFYNLDSYQHRLTRDTGKMWSEQSLFFRVIQRGKDYWDSAFFCGSCAILRRSSLEAIGGFAQETVTEDLHTSIRLHKHGYSSVYHAESLAFGIAPAQIEQFLKQRIRWGQGAMQVWRKEGIIFNRHLTLPQKLNYLASMLIYFDGWQKLLFYVTPVVVLVTGMMPIVTELDQFLWHFIPFFVMSLWCFEELGRGYSEVLFVEQYNMARFGGFIYSTFGLFFNNLKFRVTNKKMTANKTSALFLWPQMIVLLVNLIAIPIGVIFYYQFSHLNYFSLVANLVWATVNMALAFMVITFSNRRANFKRTNYRFSIPLVARLHTSTGRDVFASVDDLSASGMFLMVPNEVQLARGETFAGTLFMPDGPLSFEAVVRSFHDGDDSSNLQAVGCEMIWKDTVARSRLERFLYGSDLEWHINNYTEKNWTLLSGVSTEEHKVIALPSWNRTRTSTVSPLVLGPVDASSDAVNTGIVTMDGQGGSGTILSFKPLAEHSAVETTVLTPTGWKTLRARVANQNKADRSLHNMYLYKLDSI